MGDWSGYLENREDYPELTDEQLLQMRQMRFEFGWDLDRIASAFAITKVRARKVLHGSKEEAERVDSEIYRSKMIGRLARQRTQRPAKPIKPAEPQEDTFIPWQHMVISTETNLMAAPTRYETALRMREAGLRYRDIGKRMRGVTVERARQIVAKGERERGRKKFPEIEWDSIHALCGAIDKRKATKLKSTLEVLFPLTGRERLELYQRTGQKAPFLLRLFPNKANIAG